MLTNFLGPLHLTKCLEGALRGSSSSSSSSSSGNGSSSLPSRVVNVSSRLEKGCSLSDTELAEGPTGVPKGQYSMSAAYADSKHAWLLASLGLAREQQRKAGGPAGVEGGYVVHSVTPGMVHTSLARFLSPPLAWLAWPVQRLFLRSPQQGAAPAVYAATAPEPGLLANSGQYYASDSTGACAAIEGSLRSRDEALAPRVLEGSLRVIAEARERE